MDNLNHKKAIEYKKSWKYITKGIKSGKSQEAPIAVKDKNGKMWLLAGNTRLMAQTGHGNKIPIKIIRYEDLLNQTYTDTLCGTKVLRRTHYQAIAANRIYFGDFDPFGDFDLIFGAAKLHLRVVEIPIRYASRVYGTTQISRFRHGFLLLRMVVFAWRKLKAL